MHAQLRDDAVFILSSTCSVRPQEQQVVIYNSKTDELHLVPLPAYYLVQLCDGLNTVADLEKYCREATGAEAPRAELEDFLLKLVGRGVLHEVQNQIQ